MQKAKAFALNEYLLVFLFSLAVILGPSITVLLNPEIHTACTDCNTYTGLAHLNLDQSPVRRYRPIVPALVIILHTITGGILGHKAPIGFQGDFSVSVCYFIINLLIMALYGLLIYRYLRAYGLNVVSAGLGLMVMLTCRWTSYWAGLEMVDSLYCFVIALLLLGIKLKDERMVMIAILLGPLAKEAFIFFIPVILLFSPFPKWRALLYLAMSAIIVLSFRYLYDRYAALPPSNIDVWTREKHLLSKYALGLFTPNGLYKIFSVTGLWVLVPIIAAAFTGGYFKMMRQRLDTYIILFMLGVLVHMIFGSYERHFYISLPVLCLIVGLSAQWIMEAGIIRKK